MLNRLLKTFRPQPAPAAKSSVWVSGTDLPATGGVNDSIQWSKYGAALALITNHAVFRCVTKRADTVAATGWRVVNVATNEVVADHDDHHNNERLTMALHRFAQRNDGTSLFYLWETHKATTGEVFIELLRDVQTFLPTDFEFLNSLYTYAFAPDGYTINHYLYTGATRTETLRPNQVTYDRTRLNIMTEVRGYSPLLAVIGGGSVNIMRAAARTAQAYFDNDATPGALAMPEKGATWQAEEMQRIRAAMEHNKGSGRKYKLNIQPFNMEVQQFPTPDLQKWAELLATVEPQIYTAYGVPRSVAGDSDSTRYQASPDDVPNFHATIVTELQAIAGVVNAKLIPFLYGGQTPVRFEFDLSPYEHIRPANITLARESLSAGAITINRYLTMVGLPTVPDGDVYLRSPGIVVVTPEQVMQQIATPAPMLPPDTTPPTTTTEQTPPVDETKDAIAPLWVGLDLSHNPDLIDLQNKVKRLFPEGGVTWTPPGEFHITLLYAPSVTPEQESAFVAALAGVTLPGMSLPVGSLASFDNVGEHALHFRIRRDAALYELQETLFDIAAEIGIQTSAYSVPEDYKPHITMGYSQSKLKPVTFTGKLRVRPHCLLCDVNKEERARLTTDGMVAADAPPADHIAEPVKMVSKLERYSHIDFKPSDAMREEAERGLAWRREHGRGGTEVGIARARDISNGVTLSPETVKRMKAFFDRHEGNKQADGWSPGEDGYPSNGRIAWALWGGDAGYSWSRARVEQMDAADRDAKTADPIAEQLDELAAWSKKWRNGGTSKALSFVVKALPESVAYFVRQALEEAGDNGEAVKAAFASWRTVLEARRGVTDFDTLETLPAATADLVAQLDALGTVGIDDAAHRHYAGVIGAKALTDTRARFEAAFARLLRQGFDEKLRPRVLIDRIIITLDRYCNQAWADAYSDIGVQIDWSDDADEDVAARDRWVRRWVDSQRDYVENIVGKLYEDDALTLAEITEQKPALWWAGSVYPSYANALLTANGAVRLRWTLGVAEHCDSCLALNGQVRTARFWAGVGVKPKDRRLQCSGLNCACEFEIVNGATLSTGRLPRWEF